MEIISVFDMFKIGIGPSSSHTLGPWKAGAAFIDDLKVISPINKVKTIEIHLFGSLALTGVGHGTDIAVLLGLSGQNPETIPVNDVQRIPQNIYSTNLLNLNGEHPIFFNQIKHLIFHFDKSLDFHPNGMQFKAWDNDEELITDQYYYSVGGGFITKGEEVTDLKTIVPPYYCDTADGLQKHCENNRISISKLVLENEKTWRSESETKERVWKIWKTMRDCVYRGCHAEGQLPGGLNVTRRAANINKRLLGKTTYSDYHDWIDTIQDLDCSFQQIMKWISCFAMAVNEENAGFGRVVTSPTNGAAGVIPAVLHYYICFAKEQATKSDIIKFLLTASEIGALFKKKATISAAMGGCQAEIGVSSAMAAAALTERLGGTVDQALEAAEIAMEHHLGMTCDPIGGLVQIPCIERNSMGAIKAIMASNIALDTDTTQTKVSLDQVIKTMWETALDMNHKYKETSQGGLATNVRVAEC
ncbi:MAG: L-serine ammonia-lyase [Saprospiraceae bacterium]